MCPLLHHFCHFLHPIYLPPKSSSALDIIHKGILSDFLIMQNVALSKYVLHVEYLIRCQVYP